MQKTGMALSHFTVSALLNLYQRIPITIYNCHLDHFIFSFIEGGTGYCHFTAELPQLQILNIHSKTPNIHSQKKAFH